MAGRAHLISQRGDRGVVRLLSAERRLEWIDGSEYLVFQTRVDGARRAIRKATDEDIRKFRVPIWIQGQEIPLCCGREMVFVGQLDDDTLCTEPPEGAKMWWHDGASFYVFTCPICLTSTAIGQQF